MQVIPLMPMGIFDFEEKYVCRKNHLNGKPLLKIIYEFVAGKKKNWMILPLSCMDMPYFLSQNVRTMASK